MTIRNLDALFEPKSIALIGASAQPNSVGAVTARNLLRGGFKGTISFVNPHEREILGVPVHASIADLPAAPDLAVIATPARTVPALVQELGARGCRAAIVISAGFSAGNLRQELLTASGKTLLRVLGPNCLGFLSPVHGVNASFSHITPTAGSVALVSQSGAIATAMMDWAAANDVGFSHVVSLGDMSDIDFGDMLDYLALDAKTNAILLYAESITHARKFMSAGRIAARAKPVIVVKAGRTTAGARAAATHTGALAGADLVYDAAFRRAGMLRVGGLRDLFDAAATLASGIRVGGDRLTIVTNGGGAGVLAADALEAQGGRLAQLDEATVKALDAVLPSNWSKGNPIDIIGDADAQRYVDALSVIAPLTQQDAILVMNCPTGVADSSSSAHAVAAAVSSTPTPVLTCWLGEATTGDARSALAHEAIPSYETPTEAVTAFMHLVEYRRNQAALIQTPAASPAISPAARANARAIVAAALADGRTMLTEPEAKDVLSAYGVETTRTLVARTPEESKRLAQTLTPPYALKILSRDISHKSDVGGVRLDLKTAEDVERATQEIAQSVAAKAPQARIDGYCVQEMISRPLATELIVGLSVDPTFGPVILFGHGGVAVEVIADSAIALPPLNGPLADDLIGRTRIAKLLQGYRNVPAANMGAIQGALIALSSLAADIPEIAAIDVNPLLADSTGAIALDARIEVRPSKVDSSRRFAIRPYPDELRREVETRDGATFSLRPIRPDDEPAIVAMCAQCTPNDLRLRFFGPIGRLSHALASRLTQIDYDREMALVAEDPALPGILGVARLVFDPDFKSAEYAILVRSDLQGLGLGHEMMKAILAYARERGAERVVGDVLRENAPMVEMVRTLGGDVEARTDDVQVLEASFDWMA